MLNRLFPNRAAALTVILFAAAFLICGVAWMRVFTAAVINPSPVRYMHFVTETGGRNPFPQTCVGPAFIEGDQVWRYCEYAPRGGIVPVSMTPDTWGLVLFDLKAGDALMRWPLPEAPDAQILALAPAPNGDLAVAWGSPGLRAIYHVRRAGGVESLGVPPESDRVLGLVWIDSSATLELAIEIDASLAIARYEDSEWRIDRTLPFPVCVDEALCSIQAARHSASQWQLIYAAAFKDSSTIEIRQQDEANEELQLRFLSRADLDASQYTLNDNGDLIRIGVLVDQSPSNVINWALDAAPLMQTGDTWERLAAPLPDASFYFSNYEIAGDRLRWIPGLRYPNFSWYLGEWITLQASDDGVALAQIVQTDQAEAAQARGKSGDTLTTDRTFIKYGAQTCVLPASDGGYWILGANGAYLKADDALGRADSLTVFERIRRSFENFRVLKAVQDGNFYREQRALKMAAFPLVLLTLPVGYLLVVFVRQTRPNTRAWMTLLLQVSAIYVVLATIFFWWFWEMTDQF